MIYVNFVLSLIIIGITPYAETSAADVCPTPPNVVDAKVEGRVKFDKKSNLYLYSYVLKNESNSRLPADSFYINLKSTPSNILSPTKWDGGHNSFQSLDSELIWVSIGPGLKKVKVSGASHLKALIHQGL